VAICESVRLMDHKGLQKVVYRKSAASAIRISGVAHRNALSGIHTDRNGPALIIFGMVMITVSSMLWWVRRCTPHASNSYASAFWRPLWRRSGTLVGANLTPSLPHRNFPPRTRCQNARQNNKPAVSLDDDFKSPLQNATGTIYIDPDPVAIPTSS